MTLFLLFRLSFGLFASFAVKKNMNIRKKKVPRAAALGTLEHSRLRSDPGHLPHRGIYSSPRKHGLPSRPRVKPIVSLLTLDTPYLQHLIGNVKGKIKTLKNKTLSR